MKRNKSPDGYRSKILQVRLTEVENAAFQILYEKAKINNEGLLVSVSFASSFYMKVMIKDLKRFLMK